MRNLGLSVVERPSKAFAPSALAAAVNTLPAASDTTSLGSARRATTGSQSNKTRDRLILTEWQPEVNLFSGCPLEPDPMMRSLLHPSSLRSVIAMMLLLSHSLLLAGIVPVSALSLLSDRAADDERTLGKTARTVERGEAALRPLLLATSVAGTAPQAASLETKRVVRRGLGYDPHPSQPTLPFEPASRVSGAGLGRASVSKSRSSYSHARSVKAAFGLSPLPCEEKSHRLIVVGTVGQRLQGPWERAPLERRSPR